MWYIWPNHVKEARESLRVNHPSSESGLGLTIALGGEGQRLTPKSTMCE